MSESEHKNKAEEEKPIHKMSEYRKFKKLLKRVIKAPPMRKSIKDTSG